MDKSWTKSESGIYWKQDPEFPKNPRKKIWKAVAYCGTGKVYSEKKGRMVTKVYNTTSETFRSEAEAKKWKQSKEAAKTPGVAESKTPTHILHFDKEHERYVEKYSPKWTESSRNANSSYGKRLVAYFGSVDPRDIQTIEIENFFDWCREAHEAFPQSLGNNTLTKVKSYMRRMFEQWEKEPARYGGIRSEIVRKATIGKVTKYEAEIWTKEQVNEALQYALQSEKDISRAVLIGLGCIAGLRRGELAGLQWRDIDYEKHIIDLQRQRVQHNVGEETLNYLKKGDPNARSREGRRLRYVAMPEPLEKLLKLAYQQQTILAGKKPKKTDFVYRIAPCVINGYEQNPRKLSSDFSGLQDRMAKVRELAKKEPLPHLRLHDMRHSNISCMLNDKINVISVAANSGHISNDIKDLETLKTYWTPDADRSDILDYWQKVITIPIETPESLQLQRLITSSNRKNLRSDEIF